MPGPWQAEQNRVPPSKTTADVWILGSSTYSAHMAAQLGRPYAFALQFGSADILNTMRIYRENFRPSKFLAKPYSLVSIGVIADEYPIEARRQSKSTAMAMLRMFQRKPFALLPPDEVAKGLENLQKQTGVDEIMMVVQGYSRRAQSRTVELIANHYDMLSN